MKLKSKFFVKQGWLALKARHYVFSAVLHLQKRRADAEDQSDIIADARAYREASPI